MILCHSSFKSDHKQNGFDQFGPSSECVHSFASCSCSYAYVHAPYIYLCVSHARNSKFVRFRSISPAPERRFVVGTGAERRPTVFVMARWFQRIAVKNHTYIFPSSFFVGVFIFSYYVLVVARSVPRRFTSKEFSYIGSRYIRHLRDVFNRILQILWRSWENIAIDNIIFIYDDKIIFIWSYSYGQDDYTKLKQADREIELYIMQLRGT